MGSTLDGGVVNRDDRHDIFLTLKEPSNIPIEANSISPDNFIGRTEDEIRRLPLLYGRRQLSVSDLFTVDGEDGDAIVLQGDLSHVKQVGRGMTRGSVTVYGDTGMHLGAEMSGGQIIVHGDAGAWAGAQMSGGHIWIHGNAGPMLGAMYTGETLGMRGGIIIVDGNAGPRAAERMRRGIIVVQGDVGPFAGARMVAGSLVAFGKLGGRPGAGMKRGTLVALNDLTNGVLPTFRFSCTCQCPVFMRYYLRRLQTWGLSITGDHVEGRYRRYTGDVTTIGKGEIFVYDQRQ